MTRGITEIARLGVAMGGHQETFAGLSGIGDLIVTCTSMHSRNRRAGILIGKGMTAAEAQNEVDATPSDAVYDAVNRVRGRVGMPTYAYGSKNQSEMREIIRHERRVGLLDAIEG